MILIYYKNAAGKVCRLFWPPKGWTREDLTSDLNRANNDYGGGYRAYARLIRKHNCLCNLWSELTCYFFARE